MNRMRGRAPAGLRPPVSGSCRTAARPRRAHRQVRPRPAAAERHAPAVGTCAVQTEWRLESLVIARRSSATPRPGISPVPFAFAWVLNNRRSRRRSPAARGRAARGLSAGARVCLRARRRGAGGRPRRDRPSSTPGFMIRPTRSKGARPGPGPPSDHDRRLGAADAEARLEALRADARYRPERRLDRLRHPLAPAELEAYWRDVLEAVRERGRILLAAFEGDTLIGSVQLGPGRGERPAPGRGREADGAALPSRPRRGPSADAGAPRGCPGVRTDPTAARRAWRAIRGRRALQLDFVPFSRVPAMPGPDGRLADTSFYYLQVQSGIGR